MAACPDPSRATAGTHRAREAVCRLCARVTEGRFVPVPSVEGDVAYPRPLGPGRRGCPGPPRPTGTSPSRALRASQGDPSASRRLWPRSSALSVAPCPQLPQGWQESPAVAGCGRAQTCHPRGRPECGAPCAGRGRALCPSHACVAPGPWPRLVLHRDLPGGTPIASSSRRRCPLTRCAVSCRRTS